MNFIFIRCIICISLVLFFNKKIGDGASFSESHMKSVDPVAEQPNVIIFLADDLGYGDLSYSGHPTSNTVNIDNLAQKGRFLTNFYVTSPVCSPSRASLLTGRYQMRSGVWPQVFFPQALHGLPKTETTLANILKNSGYKTEIIGKWHLGVGLEREYLPGDGAYGFDSYLGIPYSHDMCPCPVCYPDNGPCSLKCGALFVSCPLFSNKTIIDQPVYFPTLSERYVNEALQFITQSNIEGAPFFLYFAFPQIHVPQFASSQFVGQSPRGETGDSLLELDWMVGEIMALLDTLGIGNNTLTWFTSDNGADLGHHEVGGSSGHLRCGKSTSWDGGVRVPSIIHWPGKILSGRSSALSSALDILPTISSIVGGQYENLILDGVDLSTVLFNNIGQSPRNFYAVYPEIPSPEEGPYAVIYNQYKAHFYTKGSALSDDENTDFMCTSMHEVTKHDPPLLFDLHQDPGERWDLGNQSEYSSLMLTMSAWRQTHMAGMEWMDPLTHIVEKRAQPCCSNSNCEPYPICCDCSTSSNVKDFFYTLIS